MVSACSPVWYRISGGSRATSSTEDGVRLTVESGLASELTEGDSVAVNGVCLTATEVGERSFAAEVMNETLQRSSLREARAGTEVNLELPLRASDRLGGHVVQGHVDGVGTVREIERRRVRASRSGRRRPTTCCATSSARARSRSTASRSRLQGSMTTSFTVSLIPETLERTNLGRARAGTRVNLEVDVLAKYVEKLVGAAR